MQLGGYQRCRGCGITMVDCVKDFLYGRFLCTGSDQELWKLISCFTVIIFSELTIFPMYFWLPEVVGYLEKHYPYKVQFSLVVRIE